MSSNTAAAGGSKQSADPPPTATKAATRVRKHTADGDKPYSVFTYRAKALIVSIASFSTLFSSITANIYFPVARVIANEFHKSVEINDITITMFIILQGISPMFWGTVSDYLGRRPIMFACLATLFLSCVGFALVLTSAYWLWMLLRCLQATGSASTSVVGAGIIADIATPAERGGFFAILDLGPLVGPALGPVIGGALAQGFGWSAIFWFLSIGSAICGLGLLLFLPETLRVIVGDGSISARAGWIYTPSIPIIARNRKMVRSNERPPRKPFKNPFLLFSYPDIFVLLLFNGTYAAILYGVIGNLSVTFRKVYGDLTPTHLGLCFLPLGGGMLVGSSILGRFMDAYYMRIMDSLIHQARAERDKNVDPKGIENELPFPIEKARLRVLPYIMFVYMACIIGYGWSLQSGVTIVVPLILQFVIGITVAVIMNSIQVLLVDLVPDQGSSITACSNAIRCIMSATLESIMRPILVRLGDGWTYTLLGGLCVFASPLLYFEIRWGPIWRERRHESINQ